jgi:hypothetical protein
VCSSDLGGSWWLYHNNDKVEQFVDSYSSKGKNQPFLALEAQYTAAEIEEAHRSELPDDRVDDNIQPALLLYPYLLLDVVYNNPDQRSREAVILWNMDNGEIVLDTNTWQTTRGLGRLVDAQADQSDYEIVKALSAAGGKTRRDHLVRALKTDVGTADEWLDNARNKGLIVQEGNSYRLRDPNLRLNSFVATNINGRLATKPYARTKKQSTTFNKEQIKLAAQAILPPNVTVRELKEVFLPVYGISLTHPDGSIETTYWNALNGQKYVPQAQQPVTR